MTRTREENALDLMHESDKSGLQVTAYFRNLINAELGIEWKECVRIGELFNETVEQADWLSTDIGMTFDKSYTPKEMKND